jgi:5-methylcytosine-specific restriction endonuclease McrA
MNSVPRATAYRRARVLSDPAWHEKDKERRRQYYSEHREEIRRKDKEKRVASGEVFLASRREYYAKNRDRKVAYQRAWRSALGDVARELRKARYKELMPRYAETRRFHHAKRKALLRGANGQITKLEWEAILVVHNHRCVYCGIRGDLTMDHIVPISGGGRHDALNIAPACLRCNVQKKALSVDVFLSRRRGAHTEIHLG